MIAMEQKQKKKMGRPPLKDKAKRRNKYVSFPLTMAEKKLLKAYAKEKNISVSEVIRTTILKYQPQPKREKPKKEKPKKQATKVVNLVVKKQIAFSKQEILGRLTRKRTAAELQLITANRRAADGSSYYAVKKTELELEIKFLQSIIDHIAPGEDISLSPIRDKAIIDLPISVRLYGVLKKNLGNGSHDVSLREIESIPLSEIRTWQNFGKKTEEELIELCELNDIKLQP